MSESCLERLLAVCLSVMQDDQQSIHLACHLSGMTDYWHSFFLYGTLDGKPAFQHDSLLEIMLASLPETVLPSPNDYHHRQQQGRRRQIDPRRSSSSLASRAGA
jgi:hypothetical protein